MNAVSQKFILDKNKSTGHWCVKNTECGHSWITLTRSFALDCNICPNNIKLPNDLCDKRDFLNKLIEFI